MQSSGLSNAGGLTKQRTYLPRRTMPSKIEHQYYSAVSRRVGQLAARNPTQPPSVAIPQWQVFRSASSCKSHPARSDSTHALREGNTGCRYACTMSSGTPLRDCPLHSRSHRGARTRTLITMTGGTARQNLSRGTVASY